MAPVLTAGRSIGDSLVRCGECYACAAREAWEWSTRARHDFAHYGGPGYLLTLTYDPEHLPVIGENTGTLVKRDWQLFNKRLRKQLPGPLRFFMCGEYGTKKGRPHYHACVWNTRIPDLALFTIRDSRRVFHSDIVSTAWQNQGFAEVEELDRGAIAYVAGYVQKKLGPRRDATAYRVEGPGRTVVRDGTLRVEPDTLYKEREFRLMSRGGPRDAVNPTYGLGYEWIKANLEDVYANDYIREGRNTYAPPRYYDQVAREIKGEDWFEELKAKRAAKHQNEEALDRRALKARHEGYLLKRARLERDLRE